MTQFIDVTPTWTGLLPALLAVLEDGNAKGKAIAKEELARMATAADAWNEHVKAQASSEGDTPHTPSPIL